MTSWTPDRVDKLTAMWESGASAGLIAAEIGMTKNAVIGKSHRMGLTTNRVIVTKIERVISIRRKIKSVEPSPAINGSRFEMTSLFNVEDDQCRYPLDARDEWDVVMFCGKKKLKDKPYCQDHHAACCVTPRGESHEHEHRRAVREEKGAEDGPTDHRAAT